MIAVHGASGSFVLCLRQTVPLTVPLGRQSQATREHQMAENKLTDKHLRGLKPGPSEKTLGDGGGLWVRVMLADKGGAINFYYRFQFGGKERRYNCGTCLRAAATISRCPTRPCPKLFVTASERCR